MYIGKDKIGYLINSKLNKVVNTGIKIPVKGEWLLDGEYITKNKNGEDIQLYMIFDVYWAENTIKPANHYPFISKGTSRLELLNKFKEYVKQSEIVNEDLNIFRVDFKVYEYGLSRESENKDNAILQKSIFIKSKMILDRADKDGYEYSIDGLIYLPTNMPVKADKDMNTKSFINGTWEYNYKWKPPEENTIDFKIKIYPYSTTIDGSKIISYYKKVNLIVSYDESQDDSIQFCHKMLLKKENRPINVIKFNPEYKFDVGVTNIPLYNNIMKCEKDNREIKDGDIIEMRYNEHGENGMIWEPLRIRDDKKDPQFFLIANNVWDTIINPVTRNMIEGYLNMNKISIKENNKKVYYVEDQESESISLRKFHNFIKHQLITGVCSLKSVSIMDTSIGRGGDISHYIQDDIKCNQIHY